MWFGSEFRIHFFNRVQGIGEDYFHLNKFSVKMSNIESQEDYCQTYNGTKKKKNDIFRS